MLCQDSVEHKPLFGSPTLFANSWLMYTSSWQKASRSSHPDLWNPPISKIMQQGNDANKHSDAPTSSSSSALPKQQIKLPSVSEILRNIDRNHEMPQQTFSVPINYREYIHSHSPPRRHDQWSQLSPQPKYVVHNPAPGPFADRSPHTFVVQHSPVQDSFRRRHSEGSEPSPRIRDALQADDRYLVKRGRKKKANTVCKHCSLTLTPEWRRGPQGLRTLCNACGLFYLKLNKKFGSLEADLIFAYKKEHNEVDDRIVPSMQQKREILRQMMTEQSLE